jgi:hypothetical protein
LRALPPTAISFPGVEVKARLFRQYPLGPIASHAIGYINRINKRDLELIEESEQAANYKGTDHIGKTGIEQKYEFQLHGETGYEQVEIDAGGRAVRNLSRTAPVQGNNLTLTLDAKIAGDGRKGFRRPPRRAGGDRAVDRWHPRAGLHPHFSTRICLSTGFAPMTGICSTIRPTSRCSTGH